MLQSISDGNQKPWRCGDCLERGLKVSWWVGGDTIAEGIETALSAAIAFTPVWSLLDAGNLGNFPAIQGVEALTIIADDGNRGRSNAQKCLNRWITAGREVRLWLPPPGQKESNDFNDWAAA